MRIRASRARWGPVLLAAIAVAGCDDTATAAAISRETFIEVVVALREAARDEPADFRTRKAEILENAGVTDSLLFAFLRTLESPTAIADVWEEVNAQMNEPPEDRDDEEEDEGEIGRDSSRSIDYSHSMVAGGLLLTS